MADVRLAGKSGVVAVPVDFGAVAICGFHPPEPAAREGCIIPTHPHDTRIVPSEHTLKCGKVTFPWLQHEGRKECPMTKILMHQQPDLVRSAVRRLLKEHGFAQTPVLAENAIDLVVRLHESGIREEDELVELAALSGGKPLDERAGSCSSAP